ncbi:hypothetical protein BLNAU_3372 [Blattamonas nauphoetae]|uniref:Uncharacterized protein n=1 Tax=Blattamonas nauphoetae TaxID=2049346 RepID=A0ABQ9YCV9_9EUKA|nr:hypothetical protein BLNAU_3372 [Blattamonas nauphoetae]
MDSRFTRPSSCPFNTQLISSDLVNMSSPGHLLDEMASRYVNDQHVIGCSVSHCTNHQHGTAMLDPASGGNLHCINSSFSNCIRSSNTILDRSDRSYYSVNQVFATGDTTGHFLRCVFCNMTLGSYEHRGGTAIIFSPVKSSLNVTLCAFHNCNSDLPDTKGGAVTFYSNSPTNTSFTLLQSVFTYCSANSTNNSTSGGSVHAATGSTCQATISDCAFENSFAGGCGGAVSSENVHLTITNTLFRKCSCRFFGGALRMMNTKDLLVLHCAFRECSSGSSYSGAKDVSYDSQMNRQIGELNFGFCDSSSGGATVYCESLRNSSSKWIPYISRSTTVKNVDISYTKNSMKMTIVTDKSLLGSMFVLLDGAEVPHLIQVPFGQDFEAYWRSEIKIATGHHSLLPSDVSFRVRDVGFVGWTFSPSIFSVETKLTNDTNCEIELFGMNLPGFSSLNLSFYDSRYTWITNIITESLKMTVKTSSSCHDTFHFGDSYVLGEIRTDGTVLASKQTLSFRVPLPPAKLSSLSTTDYEDGSFGLQFFGENLHSTSYEIVFSTDDNHNPPHNQTLRFESISPTELETLNISIREWVEKRLLPDREYNVTSAASLYQNQSIEIDYMYFRTPLTPPSPPEPKKPMPAWLILVIVMSSLGLAVLVVGLICCGVTGRLDDCFDCCYSCPTPTCSRPSCHRPSCTCPSGCRPEKSAIVCCAPNNVNCCSKCCIISVTFLCCGKSQEDSPDIQNNHPTPKEVEMRYVDDYTLPHTESPRGTSRVAGRTECRQEIYRSRTTVLE